MSTIRSHLTILQATSQLYPEAPAFRVPRFSSPADGVQLWDAISYVQFLDDVERTARHWSRVLRLRGIPSGAVVGLWIGGMTYADATLIYGLSRAGFIPQLFSLRLPNPIVVQELLARADAKVLIHDPCYREVLEGSSFVLFAVTNEYDPQDDFETLAPVCAPTNPSRTVFIFHTSGSTSGSPKLVPCTYGWLDNCILKAAQVGRPVGSSRHDVINWMGSMCHIAQTFMFASSILYGSCMVQPTKIAFSSEELVDMIQQCGLNRLNQFPTFLGTHLRNARSNPKLLALLRGLDQIVYSGLALPREDEEWTSQNGLKIRNLFGSTEVGAMLIADPGGRLLRPLEGTAYDFVPIEPSSPVSPIESGHTSLNHQLLEMVILSRSGDCPDPALRQADGHFHTGDLFQEVQPGSYVSRGRNDDWIKSENSLRCDTKSIEDNARVTCPDLISECIVVGNRRPSPVLFIEPTMGDTLDRQKVDKLKKEIIRRTRHFHARRYEHEKLAGIKFIVVVEKGALPRTATKGNIRRRAVEEQYESLLDSIFLSQ